MNSKYAVRLMLICGTLLGFSTTTLQAGCANKDRPATPTNLRLSQKHQNGSFRLFWTQNQTRSGLTFYDIHVHGPNFKSDIVGGAGQESKAGQLGSQDFNNVFAPEIFISMRARTKGGTDGCVSQAESEVLHVKGPFGGAPLPKGLPGVFPGNIGTTH